MTPQATVKIMRKAAPYLTMATALAVLSLCMTSMAYSTSLSTSASMTRTSISSPALPTYPVKVRVSPKNQTIPLGGTITLRVKLRNTGTASMTVTGCGFTLIKVNGSSVSTTLPCFVEPALTIRAGKAATIPYYSLIVSPGQPGNYVFQIYFTGTVGLTAEMTETCKFTVVVS